MNPGEVAGEVVRMAEEFERAKIVLCAMVRSKRRREPDPEAWAAAFELADAWQKAGEGLPRPTTVKCPECSAVLPNVTGQEGEIEPSRIDCGPVHTLFYENFSATVGEGKVTIHAATRGAGSIVVGEPVFGNDEPETEDEGEEDADVSD